MVERGDGRANSADIVDEWILREFYPLIGELAVLHSANGRELHCEKSVTDLMAQIEELSARFHYGEKKAAVEAMHAQVRGLVFGPRRSIYFYCSVYRLIFKPKSASPMTSRPLFDSFIEKMVLPAIDSVLMAAPLLDQQKAFELMGWDDSDIAELYIQFAIKLNQRSEQDVMRCGVMKTLEVIPTFVQNGKTLGFFAGIQQSEPMSSMLSKGKILVNCDNPHIANLVNGPKSQP